MFKHSFFPLAFILSFFISFSHIHPATAQFGDSPAEKHVSIRLLPEKTDVKGGETITVGIEQTIDEKWHTYWFNPGDSGTYARIKWGGVEKIDAAPIQWPIPKKLPIGPLMNFGYEEKVVLLQDVTLPAGLPEGPQTITAEIDILVCHEICIPETHQASFTINGGAIPADLSIQKAREFLPVEMGWATTISEESGDLVVTIKTDTPSAFAKLESIDLYPEEWGLILNGEKTKAAREGDILTLRHKRGERALSEVPVSKLVITYEDTAGNKKGFRVSTLAESSAPLGQEDGNKVGIFKAILLALFGGLILNLMPCVFPVLSMKALSLVQLKDKDIAIARKHGIAYTLGILACFALIAGILIALKAGGTQVGWGFQLQHPVIILFLSYLFFLLGLNLAGYFEIDFGLSNVGHKLTAKEGVSGSFFTGVLATLVATPCTAPFMGVAMGYALTQPAYISLLVFMSLGLGLALPYLAMTFIPAVRHILPKPGLWMEKLRQFLAFPMFASACWLLWVLSQQISHMGQFAALLGMLALVFGLWLLKQKPAKKFWKILTLALALASFGFTLSTFFGLHQTKAAIVERVDALQNWEDFSRPLLEQYLEGDDPVFVNMTAAWCITCKVNEKVALSIDSTEKLFKDKGIKYLKGDWTNQNPAITNYLEEYGRSGVPIYVYYGPRNKETGARPQPSVLPQILTPSIVENALNP